MSFPASYFSSKKDEFGKNTGGTFALSDSASLLMSSRLGRQSLGFTHTISEVNKQVLAKKVLLCLSHRFLCVEK